MEAIVMTKKRIGLAIVAGIVVLGGACVLTGCGNGGSPSTSSAGTPNGGGNTPPPSVTPRPEPTPAPENPLQIVDTNSDGTWDDMEEYINETYPTSAKERAFMTQYTQALQNALLGAGNETLSLQNYMKILHAADCGEYVTGDRDRAEKMRYALKARFLSIGGRSSTYYGDDGFSANLGGKMLPDTSITVTEDSCFFDLATLPN